MQVPISEDRLMPDQPSSQAFRRTYRCSPTTGRIWQFAVPVLSNNSPQHSNQHLEWRVNPFSREKFQVVVSACQPSRSTLQVNISHLVQNQQTFQQEPTPVHALASQYGMRNGNGQQHRSGSSHQQPFNQTVFQAEPYIRDKTFYPQIN